MATSKAAAKSAAKKQTARDRGVPEPYLSESGSFRPGYDAKLKSELFAAIFGDPAPKGALREWTQREALAMVKKLSWEPLLQKAKATRDSKRAKRQRAATASGGVGS